MCCTEILSIPFRWLVKNCVQNQKSASAMVWYLRKYKVYLSAFSIWLIKFKLNFMVDLHCCLGLTGEEWCYLSVILNVMCYGGDNPKIFKLFVEQILLYNVNNCDYWQDPVLLQNNVLNTLLREVIYTVLIVECRFLITLEVYMLYVEWQFFLCYFGIKDIY